MHAVLVPVYLLLVTPITLSWWAAGSQAIVKDPKDACRNNLRRVRGKKFDICNSKPELLEQISLGQALGKRECRHQFRYRRWNCTTSRMKKVLAKDTRETAFVNAIVTAGITFQVTKACTTGELLGCSCDRKTKNKKKSKKKQKGAPEGDWEWEGCGSENIDYGIKKCKDYLDMRYRRRRNDMKTLVTLHNYGAGRLAIKNHMDIKCKCHGLSGSCTLRTCWRRMAPFREVGNRLKERFDGAVKVIAGNDGESFMPEGESIKPPDKEDLVYYEETPDFCNSNNSVGSFGTQGRECNMNSQSEEGCGILCCSRGALTQTVNETKNCNCKFEWCCEVKCEKCHETRIKNVCL